MKTVKVYGPGCKRCEATETMVKETADKLGVEVEVEKVTDAKSIAMAGRHVHAGAWRSMASWFMPAGCRMRARSKAGSRHEGGALRRLVALPCAAPAQVLDIQPVARDVWALVGPKEQRSAENLANNATFGVVVTGEGVVLIDPGGSWNGAAMIDAAIQRITDQPVTHVINTGGQDHRWLGNGYWQAQGATVIASEAAVADQKDARLDADDGAGEFPRRRAGGHGACPCRCDLRERSYTSMGGLTFEISIAGRPTRQATALSGCPRAT